MAIRTSAAKHAPSLARADIFGISSEGYRRANLERNRWRSLYAKAEFPDSL